jgi:hypothetical protein
MESVEELSAQQFIFCVGCFEQEFLTQGWSRVFQNIPVLKKNILPNHIKETK